MMLALTAEGRFESGLDALVRGKRYAFLALVGDAYPARLGVAVQNEPGYYPVPEGWAYADSMVDMQRHADALNSDLGMSAKEAGALVASTFAAGKVDLPRPDTAALQRRSERRAAAKQGNHSLEHILAKPPPRGSTIRFSDGRTRKASTDVRAPTWRQGNAAGVLVSLRKRSGQIVLRLPDKAGNPYFRTFDKTSPLIFSVEHIPVPGELFDIELLPAAQRRRERRQSNTRPSQSPP